MIPRKTLKRLLYRLGYRIAFFYFLKDIQDKSLFIFSFLPLLFYKIFPQKWHGYQTTVRIYNKQFVVRDLTDLLVIKETLYDNCYKTLFEGLQRSTTFIDIGSFIGDATIYAQNFPKIRQIVTIEPDPRNIKILEQNFILNDVKNSTFLPKAISGKTGVAYFKMGRENISSSLQKPKVTKDRVKVATISLTKVLQMVKTQDIVLKSDCEGAEYDFIMQTPPKVLSKLNKIIFEYHVVPKKLDEMIQHLKKAGFKTRYEDLVLEPNVGMAYCLKI